MEAQAAADTFTRVAERFGVPVAFGVALFVVLVALTLKLTKSHTKMCDTFAANDSKHVENFAASNLGHAITHERLNQLQDTLRDRLEQSSREACGGEPSPPRAS